MMKRNAVVIGLALLLSACGFQLRGTDSARFAIDELSVSARNAYGENVTLLVEELKSRGVRVYDGAPYKLVLTNSVENRRAASYTGAARVAEYELQMSIDYEILGEGNLQLLSNSVEAQNFYQQDNNNIVGSGQEEAQLRHELRRETVQQLVNRLSQLTPTALEELQRAASLRAEAAAQEAEAARAYRQSQTAPQQSPIDLPGMQ